MVVIAITLLAPVVYSRQGNMGEPVEVFIKEIMESKDTTSCDLGYLYEHKPRITNTFIEALQNR